MPIGLSPSHWTPARAPGADPCRNWLARRRGRTYPVRPRTMLMSVSVLRRRLEREGRGAGLRRLQPDAAHEVPEVDDLRVEHGLSAGDERAGELALGVGPAEDVGEAEMSEGELGVGPVE